MNINPISALVDTAVGAIEHYFPSAAEKQKFAADLEARITSALDADRANARDMLKSTKSTMPARLSIYVIALFSIIMGWCIVGGRWGIPAINETAIGAAGNILMIGVGLIVREVTAVFAFWMGSSDGSKTKDQIIANGNG